MPNVYENVYSNLYAESSTPPSPPVISTGAGNKLAPIIEIAFSTLPMASSPVWTDITEYVFVQDAALQIVRGRTDEFSRIQPGTLTFAVDNSDGRFTRGNTSSPYYPNVRNGRRVRVSYVYTPKNWLTNPSFESGTTGWTGGGTVVPTLATSTTHVHHGSQALLITWGAAGTSPRVETTINGLIPGREYTASGWAWVSAGDPAVKFGISGGTSGSPTNTTGAFQQFTHTFTASATSHVLQILANTSPASGDTVWIDEVQVEQGSSATAFSGTGAVLYRRFDGHINEFPVAWTHALYAPVTLTATDRFKRFGQLGELRSILEEEVLIDAVETSGWSAAYYPLGEPSGSMTAQSVTEHPQANLNVISYGAGQQARSFERAIEFGNGIGPGTDETSAPTFAPRTTTNGRYLRSELTNEIGGNGISIECWFRVSGLGVVEDSSIINRTVMVLSTTDEREDNQHLAFQIDNTGKLHARHYKDGLVYQMVSSTVMNDGETHHAVLTETVASGIIIARFYLDNVVQSTATRFGVSTPTYSRITVGANTWAGDLFTGTISHVAAYSSPLSTTRITTHFNAGKNGLVGERTDVRIGRLANYVGIPTAERVFDAGDSTVGWQSTSGAQPINAMQDVEETENGVLFMSMDSKLTFHKRSRRYNVSPFLTLSAAEADQIGMTLQFPGDDFGLINDATATRPRNSEVRAVNRASIDEFGLYRHTTTILDDSNTRAQSVVDWIVNTYGQELTRTPNVEVDLYVMSGRNPTLTNNVLSSEISHLLRLSNLPSQAPTPTVDTFIEGWTEIIGEAEWTITFNCSPAILNNVWQLGMAGLSELGLTTRLAF